MGGMQINMGNMGGMKMNMGGMTMKPAGNSWCSGIGCSKNSGSSLNMGNLGGNMGLQKFRMPITSSGCSSGNCGGGSKPSRVYKQTKPDGSWCEGTGCGSSGGDRSGGIQNKLNEMMARMKNNKPIGFRKIPMGSNGCSSGNCGGSKNTRVTNPDGSWCEGTGCGGKPTTVKRVNRPNRPNTQTRLNRPNNRPSKIIPRNRPTTQKP